jgi:hypothetical protein
MAIHFNLAANRTERPDEEQYVLGVYDQNASGHTDGLWVTHPVPTAHRTKVLSSLLDILSAIGGCTKFEEAQACVAELWLKHGLHKPLSR